MIKIVSFKICPFVQRVTTLLEAKKISYRVEYISLKDKPQWFLEVSPNGQVPLLITESGEVLFESDAIVEYIDEIYPPLIPNQSPEEKAKDRAWSYLATKNYLNQCNAQRSSDLRSLQEKSAKLHKAFTTIEAALGKSPYFKGNTLSNVDLAWLVLLGRAEIIKRYTGYDFIHQYPKLKKWQKALKQTTLFEKSAGEDFEAAFIKFYLSEDTYLGKCLKKIYDDNCCPNNICCSSRPSSFE